IRLGLTAKAATPRERLRLTWTVDGRPAGKQESLTLRPNEPGTIVVRAVVASNLGAAASREWRINVVPASIPAPAAAPAAPPPPPGDDRRAGAHAARVLREGPGPRRRGPSGRGPRRRRAHGRALHAPRPLPGPARARHLEGVAAHRAHSRDHAGGFQVRERRGLTLQGLDGRATRSRREGVGVAPVVAAGGVDAVQHHA